MFKDYNVDVLDIKFNNYEWKKLNYLANKYYLKYHYQLDEFRCEDDLDFSYDKEVDFINRHNFLVKKFLKELAAEFRVFKLFSVSIFVTGSFARFSNKINSDVDIHFLYSDVFKRFIYKYEEMYFYIVSYVLGIKRNNIHSVITTKLNKKFNSNANPLTVRLYKDDANYISYSFYENTKKRFFLQYNNSKSYKASNKYIIREILNENREWAHNFYVVLNEKRFNDNYSKLIKFEDRNRLIDLIENVRKNIKKDVKLNNDISVIKRVYQQDMFANIYNTLNLVRMYNNKNLYTLNEVLNSSFFDDLDIKFNIYKYLWLVKKLSLYCLNNNIIYSIHVHGDINYQNLEQLENLRLVVCNNLLDVLKKLRMMINE